MLNIRKTILLSLFFLLCSASIEAATWHVEKDGSGDFTVIQHAVDAASDGDTILIGPGRFVDFEPFDSGHWVQDIIIVFYQKRDLTIIGSGVEKTIVGPSSYFAPYGEDPQLIMGWFADNIRIENLKVENCEFGIVWTSGPLSVGNCCISNCHRGITSFSPDGTQIENSAFFQQGGWSIVTNGECRNITIVDSSFNGYGTGIGFNQTPDAFVTSCNFDGLYGAIGYSGVSSGQITGCSMSNVECPVAITTESQVYLSDNFLESTTFNSLYLSGNSYVSGTGNIFSGGGTEFGTLHFSGGSTADLSENHIIKGDGYSVTLANYYYEHRFINLSNNYWGTTDIETLEGWIHDSNDDPSIHGTVEFLPLADGPVSTESTTLDELKALYR